jgi:DNA-directed RNA polymerase III subunit RPC2
VSIVPISRYSVAQRPPFIEQLKKGNLAFNDFPHRGLVKYLDVNEENDAFIALYESDIEPAATHL